MLLKYAKTAKAVLDRRRIEKEKFAAVKKFLKVPAGGRLLDISTGSDAVLQALSDSGLQLYGVDISSADRKRSIDEIALQGKASIYELPYNECFFNCVTTLDTPDLWEDNKAALTEILRVLKEGGQLLCVFTFSDDNGSGTPPRTLREEARAAGFAEVRVKLLPTEGCYLLTGKKIC